MNTENNADHAAAADAETHDDESYNPWTVVNLVFTQLADQGLHPVLGEHGDPGEHARNLLLSMGIRPMAEGNREVIKRTYEHLAEIRSVMFEEK